jgi:hypothetical protein
VLNFLVRQSQQPPALGKGEARWATDKEWGAERELISSPVLHCSLINLTEFSKMELTFCHLFTMWVLFLVTEQVNCPCVFGSFLHRSYILPLWYCAHNAWSRDLFPGSAHLQNPLSRGQMLACCPAEPQSMPQPPELLPGAHSCMLHGHCSICHNSQTMKSTSCGSMHAHYRMFSSLKKEENCHLPPHGWTWRTFC